MKVTPHLSRLLLRSGLIVFLTLSSRVVSAETPSLSPEPIVLAHSADSARENPGLVHWQDRLRETPSDSAAWERLGWAYISTARRTQDAGYYKLAELTADAWEARCGRSDDAMLLRGHAFHNLHRFHEAEQIAQKLVASRGLPADYALLSDALMEQGKLPAAVAACQRLADLRPGVEAYSRIAQLRWLHGDLPGAVDVLRTAVRATDSRDRETAAWLHSRLSWFELLQGSPEPALNDAEQALKLISEYAPALTAKGRALYALGRKQDAVAALAKAAELNPIPENLWWLADAQRAAGLNDDAARTEALLARNGATADQRTYALFLATRNEKADTAERLASAELKNRADAYTHDALAFALLRGSRTKEAAEESQRALADGLRDPRVLLHAALIASSSGNRDRAAELLKQARTMLPALTPSEQALLTSDRSLRLAVSP